MGVDPYDVPRRAGFGERARRSLLALAGLGVVAGGVALAPYITVLVCGLVVWLLRSGSRAASSAGGRRQRRGVKWYDVPQVLLATPWHLVAVIPGTLVLLSWSLGLGLAAALICFAASLGTVTSLAVIGGVFGLALWWGPGGHRVRSPLRLAVEPIARRPLPWLLTTILVAALASGLTAAASDTGTSWAPDDSAPWSGIELPAWL